MKITSKTLENSPCLKQTTLAIIINDGRYYIGSNHCEEEVEDCPRETKPSGEGYELCRSICGQTAHAEIDVLEKAGEQAEGGTMFLIGHNYLCQTCKDAATRMGIKEVIIIDDLIVKGNNNG